MEEVARYLEKCHLNFEQLQQRERDKVLERSKSIANIAKAKAADLNGVTDSNGRARSSSNLYAINQRQAKSTTLDISYSAFKDFTWYEAKSHKLKILVSLLASNL